jgi:hypothetical protein
MFSLKTLIPVLTTSILLVVPAEATTSYYTGSSGETSFNTGVAGMTLLNPSLTFSSSDLSVGTGLLNASGTGIDFLGFDGGFPGFGQLDFTVNAGKLTGANAGEYVQINFPATGIFAFGFHIAEVAGTANWCIDVTSTAPCANTVFSTGPSSAQFFGIISTAAITTPLYIHPQSGSAQIVFTNFEAFGPAADLGSVPEPRTMLLVGLGLVILPLVQQKNRQKNRRLSNQQLS